MNSKNSDRRGRITRYAPLILWICLIFFLSSGSGSMTETSRFIRPLLEFLFPAASEERLQLIHFYIRKCAHFTEYGILAFFAARAFLGSRIDWLRKGRLIFALAVVLAVAVTDEINQSFIASRTSSIRDVALDLFGGTVMMLFFWFFTRKRDRTINAAER